MKGGESIMLNELKKLMKRDKGFTLIELLVVVAIIAILALIVLLALNPVEMARRSRDSRRESDMGTLRRAIDLALADGATLPNTGAAYTTLTSTTDVTKFPTGAATDLDISKYLSVVPEDPYKSTSAPQVLSLSGSPLACNGATGATTDLKYEFKSDGDVYVLRARLESEENCNAIRKDGKDDNYLEMGTDPGLDL